MNALNQKPVAFLLVLILFAVSCGGGDSEPRKFNQLLGILRLLIRQGCLQ